MVSSSVQQQPRQLTIANHSVSASCWVQVGAAAAKFQHGVVAWPQCAALVLGAICIIAWLNLR
jgi:hypothetical protein